MSAIEIFEFEQGGAEWHEARRGIPTASMYQTILAGGDGRRTYLYKLAGERITEQLATNYTNPAMERGKTMEPEVRAYYAFRENVDLHRVGFVRNGKTGCSPDALIGEHKVLEIKTTEPHLLIPMLLKAKKDPHYFPSKHYAQCQGILMNTERLDCDLVVYWPKMPKLLVRTERDVRFIQGLHDAIDVFDLELRRLVTELKGM